MSQGILPAPGTCLDCIHVGRWSIVERPVVGCQPTSKLRIRSVVLLVLGGSEGYRGVRVSARARRATFAL